MAKKGFTLAEVLITLAVIGVVAALTMPSLISKTQSVILKNQFKKAYSVYGQNLLKTALIDFDGDTGCYYSEGEENNEETRSISGCIEFYEQFAKNMNVIKTCSGSALANGCIPVYNNYVVNSGCTGFSLEYVNNNNNAYILSDGSIMIPYKHSGNEWPLFMFDVNGMKGPNKIGHDVFGLGIFLRKSSGAYLLGSNILGCLPRDGALFTSMDDINK
ncbi:MAG: type II secretion system GspH family protein [Heliobacteriaceae bacterium]|jgi:prepilin-type N-terminal cleavage/methylation domain-containing protein|nr:type II secretion system GspH family protein [Heliobacteriaceae bacterium]